VRRVPLGVITSVVLAAIAAPAAAGPNADSTVDTDVVYRTVDGQELLADVYLPAGDPDDGDLRPAVLLVHGGGWTAGDKPELRDQGRLLAEAGFVAVAVQYRLAPERPHPAASNDVKAAVRWMRKKKQRNDYGIDPARVGALGSSAGGHLVGLLGTRGVGRLDRRARVAAVVAWSGPMDLVQATRHIDHGDVLVLDDAVVALLDCTPGECEGETARKASPTTHVDKTDSPMLVVNSENELVPLRLVAPMADELEEAGVEHELVVLPGNLHAGQYAEQLWPATLAFLEEHLQA
jgi:acetyl esterase